MCKFGDRAFAMIVINRIVDRMGALATSWWLLSDMLSYHVLLAAFNQHMPHQLLHGWRSSRLYNLLTVVWVYDSGAAKCTRLHVDLILYAVCSAANIAAA